MKKRSAEERSFTRDLLSWHKNENTRSLPWKDEKDPYKIWLSEIILQQTRAEQGRPYYLKFTETFTTVGAMAAADDETVFRLWQGLGYYNRCKNMLATARFINRELKGKFPDTFEGLLQLKGIGPYTAAAIASFAYGQPCAVVDGNVYRVLARYFGINTPFDTPAGKKEFSEKAQLLLDENDSASYNQAIMDLGASVCAPRKANCSYCPLRKSCIAYNKELVDILPVRSKKTQVRKRYFNYIILQVGDNMWLRKRSGKDIWQNLYEPYLIETNVEVSKGQIEAHELYVGLNVKGELSDEGRLTQKLTHQLIDAHFYRINIPKVVKMPIKEGIWVSIAELNKLAFPKTLVSFLEKKLYF